MQANAFYNAYCNANRKSGTSPIPLWKKKKNIKVDVKELKRVFKEIKEFEENNDKDWVRQIYGGGR